VALSFRGWEIKTVVARRAAEEWTVEETDLLER
jgi:hypothetical protein